MKCRGYLKGKGGRRIRKCRRISRCPRVPGLSAGMRCKKGLSHKEAAPKIFCPALYKESGKSV